MTKKLAYYMKNSYFCIIIEVRKWVLQLAGQRHHTGVLVRSGYSSIYILLPRTVSLANGVPSRMVRWITKAANPQNLFFGVSSHHQCAPFFISLATLVMLLLRHRSDRG